MAGGVRASDERTSAENQQTTSVRVMIVDDHPIVCMGLRAGLERYPDIVVECEAHDGASALKLAGHRDIDVAIVDIRLPDVDGIDVAEQLRAMAPGMRCILISGDFSTSAFERGIRAGAHAFVLKTDSPQQLANVVRNVFGGQFCCSANLEPQLQPAPDGFKITFEHGAGFSSLSAREREMLIALANGASLKQAAISLGITYKTADYVKQTVMKKLRIHDRVELARFAVREGLMS